MIQNILREMRKRRKMTQVQLAQASGLAHNYISELERGEATNPSRQTIEKLAAALGIPESLLTTELLYGSATSEVDLEDVELWDFLLDPTRSPEEREMIPAGSQALVPLRPDARVVGQEYRGYRVMRRRPDGGTYCLRAVVRVDDNWLPYRHYKEGTGIEWGYHGQGPTALAYDMLAYECGERLARYHAQSFSQAVVAAFPRYVSQEPGVYLEWTWTGEEIRDWLSEQPRPQIITPYLPPDGWRMRPDGQLYATVYEQFLLDRRYVYELELEPTDDELKRFKLKSRHIQEEELGPLGSGLSAWQYVREVPREEVVLPYWVQAPE